MRRATHIGVTALWLLATSASGAELDLTGERAPEPNPAAGDCVQRFGRSSAKAPDGLRALLVASAAPLPPAPPAEAFSDAQAGRLDCVDTAEPQLPLAAGSDAGRLLLDVPDTLDAGCWDVAISRGCAQRRIPLHTLRPEQEPGRFSAWLDTGPVRARRAATQATRESGLRVLDVTPLTGLGGSLVRLALEEAADPAQAQAALDQLKALPELRHRAIVYRGDATSQTGWGMQRIGARYLHAAALGTGIRIALLDSAAADAHPDLPDRIALARDFTGREPAAGLHGTALAGILAAAEDGEIGSSGVAPKALLLSLAACRDEPGGSAARCWSSALVRALDAAVVEKARIAVLGWSGPEDTLVARALELAAKRGVLLVGAVGDLGDERSPAFPASHPAVLGVTAVDREENVFGPSARGSTVDLAAPGVDVAAATPASAETRSLSGSALAAAHVAGAAALLLELVPRVTSDELREALTATAVDLGEPGRDPVFGYGLVDVCGAARALLGSAREDPCPGKP